MRAQSADNPESAVKSRSELAVTSARRNIWSRLHADCRDVTESGRIWPDAKRKCPGRTRVSWERPRHPQPTRAPGANDSRDAAEDPEPIAQRPRRCSHQGGRCGRQVQSALWRSPVVGAGTYVRPGVCGAGERRGDQGACAAQSRPSRHQRRLGADVTAPMTTHPEDTARAVG